MNEQPVVKSELLGGLPPEWPEDLMPRIREALDPGTTVVVLDDDPTGTQTVHDVHVVSRWEADVLEEELADERGCFYVLTNSRSHPLRRAREMNGQIGRNLLAASRAAGRDFAVVSRSDSTLRGHFPGEVDALADAVGGGFDGRLIVPFFREGGRRTIGGVHYVEQDDRLVPAALTDYANDDAFGYESSNLREWVQEKTEGRVDAEDVAAVTIGDLREGGPKRVTGRLREVTDGRVCVVDSATYRDMEVFVLGLLRAERAGKRFLYRTAASFVAVRAGIQRRPLLEREELGLPPSGALLFVIGSHVPKATAQLNHLLRNTGTRGVQVRVRRLLAEDSRRREVGRVVAEARRHLDAGRDVAVYTSRGRIAGQDGEEALAIGERVSRSLVEIVREVQGGARCLVAKGGITSSDVATEALGMRSATVLGQVLPGVPAWRLGPGSEHPGLPYVVFPGNVGTPASLSELVELLG